MTDFRAEIREWIRENAPADPNSSFPEWERRLLAARLVCPSWPVEFGGAGRTAAEALIFAEECARAGVPRVHRGVGEQLVGPAVLEYGTAEQKARFLPRIVSGEDRYCRAWSEPDHGSDTTSPTTRGELDGDRLTISGRKTWITGVAEATRLCLLCATDTGNVLVLLRIGEGSGLSLRPVTGMACQFHEVVLRDVRAPLSDVINGVPEGYGDETTAHVGFEAEFWELVWEARKSGRAEEPGIREQLAWAYSRIAVIRAHARRLAEELAAGHDVRALESTERLLRTEFRRRFGEIALAVLGPAALVRDPTWQDVFLSTRAATMDPQPSEIRRNEIAEKVLGLPTGT